MWIVSEPIFKGGMGYGAETDRAEFNSGVLCWPFVVLEVMENRNS